MAKNDEEIAKDKELYKESIRENFKQAKALGTKIKNLKVNYLDNRLCCFVYQLMKKLIASVTTKTVITIFSGCHSVLTGKLEDKPDIQVKMLPETVLEAIKNKCTCSEGF